ncbi:uncharacterized protein LOC143021271 [Oratosquilla oratoria]|uniref:uncharacterized protein LOC143021271 n=1 Tax=Oratosquilla oratoria TaxID=337810 RepID=UPI003F7773C6
MADLSRRRDVMSAIFAGFCLVCAGIVDAEQDLTKLFHEVLETDGALQSSVGLNGGPLTDVELVYLHRSPVAKVPQPSSTTPPPAPSPLPPPPPPFPPPAFPLPFSGLFLDPRDKREDLEDKVKDDVEGEDEGNGEPLLRYSFSAFGRKYHLKLTRSSHLLSSKARVRVLRGREGEVEGAPDEVLPTEEHRSRFFTHVDSDITAALHSYTSNAMEGFIFSRNASLEIRPLPAHAKSPLSIALQKRGTPLSSGGEAAAAAAVLHVVKRLPLQQKRNQPKSMVIEDPRPELCPGGLGNVDPNQDHEYPQDILTIPPEEIIATEITTEGIFEKPQHPVHPTAKDLPPLLKRSRNFEISPSEEETAFEMDLSITSSNQNIGKEKIRIQGYARIPRGSSTLEREFNPILGTDMELDPIILEKRKSPMDEPYLGASRNTPPPPTSSLKKREVGSQGRASGPRGQFETILPSKRTQGRPKLDLMSRARQFEEEEEILQSLLREVEDQEEVSVPETAPATGKGLPRLLTKEDLGLPAQYPSLGQKRSSRSSLTIELGVFLDHAAFELFHPYLGSHKSLVKLVLAYVNGIQALYLHPTLGTKVKLVINYLEIMEKQPASLPHHGGDRMKLYESFKAYSKERNHEMSNSVDTRPWDMGLLLSGLNFYTGNANNRSFTTMGLAAFKGVCHPDYSAVITELGTTNSWGRPYPSSGFASVYVMAHEMGHNMGMLHDGAGNDCDIDGYIMSASRSTSGETNWSTCSRDALQNLKASCLEDDFDRVLSKYDHAQYRNLPGQKWDSFDQCRFFLRDIDATLYNATNAPSMCETVMCRSPNRIGYFKAGPALDGTFCGDGSWCVAGKCTPWPAGASPPVVVQGGWSAWHQEECQSGCLESATGVQISHRRCNNPKPQNTLQRCQGLDTSLVLCSDDKLCPKRSTVKDYATQKCQKFSKIVTDIKAVGAQAPHNPSRTWQACAIFCQTQKGTWYSPRTDLNHLNEFDTYFPDGTQCHTNAKGVRHYCQRHQCLPEGSRQVRALGDLRPERVMHVFQNAPPKSTKNNTVLEQISKIFELDSNYVPMQLEPVWENSFHHEEDEHLWMDDDYVHM